MSYPVIRAAAYVLVHTPEIMLEHGTTITMEKDKNPDSAYLQALPGLVRSFDQAVNYAPNQVYIGNLTPAQLDAAAKPWYENPVAGKKEGKFGEIMAEGEFLGVMKLADSFDLVKLCPEFSASVKTWLTQKKMFTDQQLAIFDKSDPLEEITALVKADMAEGLYHNQTLVGCVRQAHASDPNLSAHVVFENLACKASGIVAMRNLFMKYNIDPAEVDYIIETSEEAIGDMNQRGGGNLAKACGEVAGCINASGIDMRGFCAGPAHGLVNAAGLVQAGIFRNVVVMAGGSTAKLGMNSRDHIAKKMPALEDMIGGYAVLVSENDGVNPVIRTDIIGKHQIRSGSSPQAVIQAIIVDPLVKNNLKIEDVDIYSPELQNPEITVPAGAGDVPTANYKMVAAMAAKLGQIDKSALPAFVKQHGFTGYAPTQGHIPSGVPSIGHLLEGLRSGELQRAMIIGKGSLFLGRMTDLFDGISFILEKNTGTTAEAVFDREELKQEVRNLLADAMEKLADSVTGR